MSIYLKFTDVLNGEFFVTKMDDGRMYVSIERGGLICNFILESEHVKQLVNLTQVQIKEVNV